MVVDIDKVLEVKRYLAKINREELDNLVIQKDNKVLEIPREYAEWFKFTGLSNVDFIMNMPR